MNIIEKHHVAKLNKPTRLQDYSLEYFEFIATKSALKKAIKRNQILVDGQIASTGLWLEQGMEISYLNPKTKIQSIFKLKLEVVYEDQFLAIINKPSGYPTSGNFFKTITNALPFNLTKSTLPDALESPGPVHRLDNPTQGLLLIAKTIKAKSLLSKIFQDSEVKKTYRAIVYGHLAEKKIDVKQPIDHKPAHSIIQVQNSFTINNETFTLVKLKPMTGRTHQLRQHLQLIGHPILGDDLYLPEKLTSLPYKGLYLQSFQIEFWHPYLQRLLDINIDLPEKFVKFMTP